MTELTVSCHTPDNFDHDRRIQGIGGVNGFTPWYHPIDNVIRNIESGFHSYYIGQGLLRVHIFVKTHHSSGRKYITTDPDGHMQNNILSLPYCP